MSLYIYFSCNVVELFLFSNIKAQRSPEGISIDFVSRNIYWTDSELDIIQVANLDGTNKKTLISDDLVNPRAIVADPYKG